MKKAYLLLIAAFLFGCNEAEQPKLAGHYKARDAEFSEKIKYLLKGVKYYISGSEIYLNSDHTFHYTTCGNVITGTWKKADTEVLLTPLTNKYKTDSLNKTWPKPAISKVPMIYTINKTSLTKIQGVGNEQSVEILNKL